jgi:hypothetical protein
MSSYTPGAGRVTPVHLEAYEVALNGNSAVITHRPGDIYWRCTEHGAGHCEHVAEAKLQQFKARTQAARADEARQAELHAKAAHLVDGRIVPPTVR